MMMIAILVCMGVAVVVVAVVAVRRAVNRRNIASPDLYTTHAQRCYGEKK